MAMRDETRMLLESMTRLFEDKATKQVVDARRKGHVPGRSVASGQRDRCAAGRAAGIGRRCRCGMG